MLETNFFNEWHLQFLNLHLFIHFRCSLKDYDLFHSLGFRSRFFKHSWYGNYNTIFASLRSINSDTLHLIITLISPVSNSSRLYSLYRLFCVGLVVTNEE